MSKKVERICAICGSIFLSWTCYTKRTENSAKYCSVNCYTERTGGKIEKKCIHCSEMFFVRQSEKRLKYCSRICYYNGRRVSKEHFLERNRVKQRNRVARLHNASGDFSIEYFKWLCEKLKYICVLCNKSFQSSQLTIDHMKPITRGGKNDNKNIQPLCRSCNAKKGNRMFFCDQRVVNLYNNYSM